MTAVELALDARAALAEGPAWDPARRVLWWVNIPHGEVHRLDPATGQDSWFTVGEEVGAVALRQRGGLVLAAASGFAVCDADGSGFRRLARVHTDPPGGRMNDGACDPWGRFWAGTMLAGVPGAAALHRLDPDGTCHTMLTGVTVSNGIDWSPDGWMMYYVDTPTGGVDAFDIDPDSGRLGARRRLVDIARGKPDGLTVDGEGHLWVALWGGWAVQRFTPDGRLDRTVEIPAEQVTSCAFGGDNLDTLFVTTARQGAADGDARQPHAGGIFALRPGAHGQPPRQWHG